MANAKNKVIAGDYYNYKVSASVGVVTISLLLVETITVDKTTVKNYEVITDEHRKSAKSGVARGLAGKMLLGNVGAMAGVYSAKDKGIYQIAIEFKNGKRSLIEVDDKIYKLIIKNCFACGSDSDEETEPEQPKTENKKKKKKKKMKEVPEQSNTNGVEPPKKPKKISGCLLAVLITVLVVLGTFIAIGISSVSSLNNLNSIAVSEMLI